MHACLIIKIEIETKQIKFEHKEDTYRFPVVRSLPRISQLHSRFDSIYLQLILKIIC